MEKAVSEMSIEECRAELLDIETNAKHAYWSKEGIPHQAHTRAVERVRLLHEKVYPNKKQKIDPGLSVGLIDAGIPSTQVEGVIERYHERMKTSLEKGEKQDGPGNTSE